MVTDCFSHFQRLKKSTSAQVGRPQDLHQPQILPVLRIKFNWYVWGIYWVQILVHRYFLLVKHSYLKMPSLLKPLSLLWNERNWGPLCPPWQCPSPSQHANTCFNQRRSDDYVEFMAIWVNSRRKKESYFISLGKVSSHCGRQHFSYLASLLSCEWKWFLIFLPAPLQVFRQLPCASWQWALELRDSFSGFSHLLY